MSDPGECCRWKDQKYELVPRGGAEQAQKVKEQHSVRLHWPRTDQFINDNIFTLINSQGSLYQRKCSPSASLVAQHRSCAASEGQGKAGGAEVPQHQRQQQSRALGVWPLLRQGVLPSMAPALRGDLLGLALAMQGAGSRGNQPFCQYTDFFPCWQDWQCSVFSSWNVSLKKWKETFSVWVHCTAPCLTGNVVELLIKKLNTS